MRFEIESITAFDTETYGLNPYLGDLPFGFSFANSVGETYLDDRRDNKKEIYNLCEELFENEENTVIIHNAKFDMHGLTEWCQSNFKKEIRFKAKIICTATLARIADNQRLRVGLGVVGEDYGISKDSSVEQLIHVRKLFKSKVDYFGNISKDKDFSKVPYEFISKYAMRDARVCYDIFFKLLEDIQGLEKYLATLNLPRSVYSVIEREAALTKVLFQMERTGVLLDSPYAVRACEFERQRSVSAANSYQELTGRDFVDSGKAHAAAFIDSGVDQSELARTSTGRYSFTSEVLSANDSELAKSIVEHRESHKKAVTFYGNFLQLRDSRGRIHTSLGQSTTRTGRLSSQNPNLQNIPAHREIGAEFFERECFIAPEDFYWVSFDYKAQEMRLLFDLSGETEVANCILAGEDVHEVTAKLMDVTRAKSKNIGFGLIYGMGLAKMATDLGITFDEARNLKSLFFAKMPKAGDFIRAVIDKAERGYLANAYGRVYKFKKEFAYKAVNYLIQGTGSEIVKDAMIAIDKKYRDSDNVKMILQVHDELCFYIHKDHMQEIDSIKQIMTDAYKHNILPMDVSVKYGKNWAECK